MRTLPSLCRQRRIIEKLLNFLNNTRSQYYPYQVLLEKLLDVDINEITWLIDPEEIKEELLERSYQN